MSSMYYIGAWMFTLRQGCKQGKVYQEGKIGATRRELDSWMQALPQPWSVAMEATIFTG